MDIILKETAMKSDFTSANVINLLLKRIVEILQLTYSTTVKT